MHSYQQYHIQQHDWSDCGVACLLSVLRYFGGNASMSQLREWSGTSATGSTLLGLRQAAHQVGLVAEGFEAEMEHLKTITEPAILHVLKYGELQHFMVCYAYNAQTDTFTISDPAEVYIKQINATELATLWQSKKLLLVKPTDNVLQTARMDTLKDKIQWLYSFIEQDLNLLFTALVIGVFVSAFGLSVSVFSQKLVDSILPTKSFTKLLTGTLLLAFLLVLRALLIYIRQLLLLRQNKEFNIRIVDYFYSTLLRLPKSFFDSRKTGEVIARMNDTARIQQTISNVVTNLAIEIVVIIANTVALFYYQASVGLVSLCWLPFFAWIVYRFNKPILDGQRGVMVNNALNEGNYIDTIQGIAAIKMANKESYFAEHTKLVYEAFQESRFQLGLVGNRFGLVSQLTSSVFITGIILFSTWQVLQGWITIGTVMAIIQMVSMLMTAAASIAVINISLQEAKVALERMQEFTTLPAEYDLTQESAKKNITTFESLQVSEVDFRFTGRRKLLNHITFSVKKGEVIAILGESGGGKSTLLQLLQRFYEPEQGIILVNECNLNEWSVPSWRKLLGVVPQQVKLFNGLLLENILLKTPTEEDIPKVVQLLKEYGLDKHFERFPNGYNTILGETGTNISGGQQQLVALARALYAQPQLLLLDEATAAMDKHTERIILELLQKLRAKMGIILVTHRIQTAAIADRCYALEDGYLLPTIVKA
ncbi:MAG: peptidase domain-containing ABC transporter [Spirosomataceae bacterium]